MSLTEVKHLPETSGPIPGDLLWARVLEVASASMGDRHRTAHLVFQSFDGQTLRLGIDESGADIVRHLKDSTSKIADLVKRATGKTLRIELDTQQFEADKVEQTPTTASTQPSRPPLVQKAIDLFDAVVISVEPIAAEQSSSSEQAPHV